MSKITKLSICLFALSILMLTACSSKVIDKKIEEMYIQKAELSMEEQAILDLVGQKDFPYIVDFVVDDNVKSLQINTYELENGDWEIISGESRVFEDNYGRIALTFDNIGKGMRIAVQSEHERGSNSYRADIKFDFKGMGTATSFLTDKIIVEYEKEIPLVIQIHTKKNQISSLNPEYGFYEPEEYKTLGYEKVYAITCMFSQKLVSELDELYKKQD